MYTYVYIYIPGKYIVRIGSFKQPWMNGMVGSGMALPSFNGDIFWREDTSKDLEKDHEVPQNHKQKQKTRPLDFFRSKAHV